MLTVVSTGDYDEASGVYPAKLVDAPGNSNVREIHCPHDMPISQCREHWIQFCEEVGDTIEQRALKWALSGDTGVSSEALCAYMAQGITTRRHSAPSDASDRGRCIRLLNIIPEWIERLDEMKQLDTGTISINGADPIPVSEDTHSWTYQIPLILAEGGFDAPVAD